MLLTHTHFDHVGAVAPVARETGAPVYVSEIERPVLADIMSYVPFAGIGPYESYEADHVLRGGERLELAGFEIDVLFTPGHSPGHLTFSIPSERAVFSGDVLFQGSVGRTDLPGGDWDTLLASIGTLVESLPEDTTVYPGHMEHHHARRGAPHEPVPGGAGGGRILTLAAAQVAPRAKVPATATRKSTHSGMAAKYQAPRGTYDLLPEQAGVRARDPRRGARAARRGRGIRPDRHADLRGHRPVRAHGRRGHRHREQGDVHVHDQGGRSLTLRPEGTAPVCRAYLEHGMHKLPQPVKLWYTGPMFRYERAAGRAVTASTPRSGRRRSAPTTRRSTRS